MRLLQNNATRQQREFKTVGHHEKANAKNKKERELYFVRRQERDSDRSRPISIFLQNQGTAQENHMTAPEINQTPTPFSWNRVHKNS